jgi:hypothetical protein
MCPWPRKRCLKRCKRCRCKRCQPLFAPIVHLERCSPQRCCCYQRCQPLFAARCPKRYCPQKVPTTFASKRVCRRTNARMLFVDACSGSNNRTAIIVHHAVRGQTSPFAHAYMRAADIWLLPKSLLMSIYAAIRRRAPSISRFLRVGCNIAIASGSLA